MVALLFRRVSAVCWFVYVVHVSEVPYVSPRGPILCVLGA